ncbi:hypothetical protein ACFV4I_24565 [Nocardiopsis alba]|uniref:hypothetical protein n=1 Tax=Nocardiopsis alba TaxID=53437 RepID=UPI003665C796
MSETTTREETKREKPAKRGLHGWKAALAVFGCGTLAAFGVFGVIVGLLSTLVSTVSEGISPSARGENPPAEGIGSSRSDLAEGQMDVCSDNLDPLTTINVSRLDSGEGYIDTTDPEEIGVDGVLRLVKDDCRWDIVPAGRSTPWNFLFSYEAIIDVEAGESRDDLASDRFEALKSEVGSDFENVESEMSSPFGESSYSFYGQGGGGESSYAALVQVGSAVYSIRFEDDPSRSMGDVSQNEFAGEARKITNFLRNGFEYWIPE